MITCHLKYHQKIKKIKLRHLVVDALIYKKHQLLLIKRAPGWLEPGKWALPGGYVEKNETIQKAVFREVEEETGYQTKKPKLFLISDSPHRKNDPAQNITFTYLLNPLKKIHQPDYEVSQVKWFNLSKLPKSQDFAFDHFKIICLFKKHLQKPFNLPLISPEY